MLKDHIAHLFSMGLAGLLSLSMLGSMPVCAQETEAAPVITEAQSFGFDSQDEVNAIPAEQLPSESKLLFPQVREIPASYRVLEDTPISSDNRTKVADTTKFPYAAICKLHLYFYDNNSQQLSHFIGSGFLITPTTILTCAHCVYDVENGYGQVRRMIITPGSNSTSRPFGTYDTANGDVASVTYEARYPAEGSSTYDCALIHLNSAVGDKTGYIRLSTLGMGASTLHLSGYPAEVRGVDDSENQYEAYGRPVETFRRRLDFTVAGSGGQSGSPVLTPANEATAIFAYGYEGYNVNGGTLIDSSRVQFIAENSDMQTPVYRAYNPNSGEHFYTTDYVEFVHITSNGWNDEGLAWRSADASNGIPVYRLYDPTRGDHHYTTDVREKNFLDGIGWQAEGIAWYAPKSNPYAGIYRLYNPNTKTGQHHFTTNASEKDYLASIGWKYEGQPFNVY